MNARITQATGETTEGNHVVPSGISFLLKLCRPSAVIRLVVSIIVFSINAFVLWCLPHVREKRFKGVTPSIAHGYSSPSIVSKLMEVRVVAAFLNPHPRSVGFVGVPSIAMLCSCFKCKATTRSSLAIGEVVSSSNNLLTAFAKAFELFPSASFAANGFRLRDYFKPSKGLSDDGFLIPHNIRLLFVVPRSRLLQSARAFSLWGCLPERSTRWY